MKFRCWFFLVLFVLIGSEARGEFKAIGGGGGGLTLLEADSYYCKLVGCTLGATGANYGVRIGFDTSYGYVWFGDSSSTWSTSDYSIAGDGLATYVNAPTAGNIIFSEGDGAEWIMDATGNFYPNVNNTRALGKTDKRVANVWAGTLTAAAITLGATALTADGTELNYVDGVTSAIQTQLDARLLKAGGTMTGVINLRDGASGAGNLALSFANDTDKGIYATGTSMVFETNGATYFTISGGVGTVFAQPAFATNYSVQTGGNIFFSDGAAYSAGFKGHAASVLRVTDGSTGIRGLLGGGTAVASAAAMPLPTGNVFHVTGTTGITSITATNLQSGVDITLIFDGVLTVSDGNNLKLAGALVTAADTTLTLVFDGTNFYEKARSIN